MGHNAMLIQLSVEHISLALAIVYCLNSHTQEGLVQCEDQIHTLKMYW